ncbi:hypothetical protein Lgee_0406 [Legionella geestiana]|uniref:Uncharacterized protein n=1 Tax=Legionella geestiana TaxID=45065 RepID=A0A0W0U7E7_9GAMM|nr:hypothetical protein Lgee_0406 [Legionella geestiana]STX54533.1 Uncharacterised protein [Legionella geestiana]
MPDSVVNSFFWCIFYLFLTLQLLLCSSILIHVHENMPSFMHSTHLLVFQCLVLYFIENIKIYHFDNRDES